MILTKQNVCLRWFWVSRTDEILNMKRMIRTKKKQLTTILKDGIKLAKMTNFWVAQHSHSHGDPKTFDGFRYKACVNFLHYCSVFTPKILLKMEQRPRNKLDFEPGTTRKTKVWTLSNLIIVSIYEDLKVFRNTM